MGIVITETQPKNDQGGEKSTIPCCSHAVFDDSRCALSAYMCTAGSQTLGWQSAFAPLIFWYWRASVERLKLGAFLGQTG